MKYPESPQTLLTDIVSDIKVDIDTDDATYAFNEYLDELNVLVAPYIGSGFFGEKAKSRYISEIATLYFVHSLVNYWYAVSGLSSIDGFFENNREARFFSWYSIPPKIEARIIYYAESIHELNTAPQVVAQIAENSLVGLRRRSLGEFFTPSTVANHLLEIAAFDPKSILSKKICDPACGSGNLLASVLSQIEICVSGGELDAREAIVAINNNIFGIDIQPIAVLLTRLQLFVVSIPIIKNANLDASNIVNQLPFENIILCDPLLETARFWESPDKFDLVIGNPPFLKAITDNLPYINKYTEILSGQPNLYQLFLWWAIKAVVQGGKISYIIPLSIRSGRYLRNLRRQINIHCSLIALTNFIDRKGTFKSVNQQMLAISLEKNSNSNSADLDIRVCNNGKSLRQTKLIRINSKKVVWNGSSEPIWLISDKIIDYTIFSKVFKSQDFLKNIPNVKILNGGFVWNQNKSSLQSRPGGNTVPLISSPSIGVHSFTFPIDDERVMDRNYVNLSNDLRMRRYYGTALLLKRTTPAKIAGRRIIGVVIPSDFVTQYPIYFAENHVNIIIPTNTGDDASIYGLAGWLNSRLANFVFSMMNGSSHLSKYELEQMPSPIDLFGEIHSLSMDISDENSQNKAKLMEEIDEKIFNYFNLSATERKRVINVIPI